MFATQAAVTQFLDDNAVEPITANEIPTAGKVLSVKRYIYAAATSMPSEQGGGGTGELGSCMQPGPFALIPGTIPYVARAHPGPHPVLPANPTQVQVAQAIRQHTADAAAHAAYVHHQNTLRNMFLSKVAAVHISELKDPLLGFANVSIRAMLNCMDRNFATVTPDELTANLDSLDAPYDGSKSLIGLWDRQFLAQQFAAPHDAISEAMMVRKTIGVIDLLGVYPETIREWRILPIAQQTWQELKTRFNTADREYRRQLTVAHQHYANQAVSTLSAEANSAATLRRSVPEPVWGYCWTHGVNFSDNHTSLLCEHPAEGHVRSATFFNMQGGNNTIRRQPGEQPRYQAPNRNHRNRGPRSGPPPVP